MNLSGWRFALLAFAIIGTSCSGKGKEEGGQANDTVPANASGAGPQAAAPAIDIEDISTITDLIVA
jgi:hypothetical protein